MFEEARKALLSTTLKSGDGDPMARLSVYGQARTMGNRPIGRLELQFKEGVTVKPFQSLRPDSLAKVGYVQNDLTPTRTSRRRRRTRRPLPRVDVRFGGVRHGGHSERRKAVRMKGEGLDNCYGTGRR